MTIDINQFHGVFFDESDEHLQDMEQLLMTLDVDSPDPEELNSIFRAAHSIKGGSGIFGFDALMNLTHVMENLLDKARNQEIQVTADIVDVFLQTLDVLKDTLAAYKAQTELPQEEIDASIKVLEATLASASGEVSEEESEQCADAELTNTSNDIEGFGFFDDEEPAQETQAENQTEEIEGFGLFDDKEENKSQGQANVEANAEPSSPSQPSSGAQALKADEGFGFYEPENLPVKPAINDAAPSSLKQPIVKPVKPKPKAAAKEAASIRVDTNKIDAMVNLVGELVITQSMLSNVGQEVEGQVGERLQLAIDELQRNTREIQESVMSMRMLPVNMTFNRFPRVVRDLSSKLGKKVDLVIQGGNTEIDKSLIEKLVDPLTHLVRNSIDHGIESPEKRLESGKSENGTVILSAEQKGSSIIIGIIDDGAGLNKARILEKATQNGLPVTPDMPDSEIWQLIFQAGFSTAAEVTDVSGRGVGMDVVRRNIESIGGRIEIESSQGEGSAFYIHLPLTLAIVDGMCVSVGEQIFVIPLLNVIESFQPTASQVKTLGNDKVLWIRDQYWPLVSLTQLMQVDDGITEPTKGIVVLLESSKKRYGVLVDSLVGQQQVVIKSLEQHYKKVAGIAGATIMGDGKVAMILDADSVASNCMNIPNEEVSL
ncbi:chemotaxis protein CheA [Alteromonas mediterranea]|uniref:chemotaxis protein CheA n=1 Tax=Alteromonas mediterranea TaxID=314275 RepID=UPI00090378BA|nr:chemotaxis protein CheA [Alteromonas mediterranea]APD92759.1 chemotaxis protein CheA [Alteromonas mediterranea]APD96373.1 chemotaxis protein CheA [Alteromonas mediterranea]